MEVNPLNIFFVKSDSKGDRLLFRYPYTAETKDEAKQKRSGRHNPYAVNVNEDLLQNPQTQTSNINKGQLSGFTDEMLSTLFAVKAELCNRKFELKVNDVRFVGHPTLLPYRTNKDDSAAMILINIVFALQASASHSIVKCYYDLSARLGKALRHEEKRGSYLTEEMKIMLAAHDEVSALDGENSADNDDEEENSRHSVSSTTFSLENVLDPNSKSPFHLILQRSSLARSMKAVYEALCNAGLVQVHINKWVLLSFCLPHKAHQAHNREVIVQPEAIDKCLQKLRPYHGILLMVESSRVNPNELLESIPLDGSAALLRLIKLYSPLKSLQTLAIEADLSLTQVFQLTGHLVYWAKATVIYPLCEGNVYVLTPGANIYNTSPLVDEFATEFPGGDLLQILTEFSLPAPLWYHGRGFSGADLNRLPRVVAWLLRRRLLLQLHTYLQYNNSLRPLDKDGKEYTCEKHDVYNRYNATVSSLNINPLNVPEPLLAKNVIIPGFSERYPTENNLNQTDFSHTKPIVIESDSKDTYVDASPNNSPDDGVDVVDGPMKAMKEKHSDNESDGKKDCNSVDSGISHNEEEKMSKRPSDLSLKDLGNTSDEEKFESDQDLSPKRKVNSASGFDNVSVNLKMQNEMSFQQPTVWSVPASCDVLDSSRVSVDPPGEEAWLDAFTEEERAALVHIPAAHDPEDLMLLAQLHKKGYFRGEHHLEEIMFMENVTRSQLMQLLDKFKDALITFETEDPAVAMLYPF